MRGVANTLLNPSDLDISRAIRKCRFSIHAARFFVKLTTPAI